MVGGGYFIPINFPFPIVILTPGCVSFQTGRFLTRLMFELSALTRASGCHLCPLGTEQSLSTPSRNSNSYTGSPTCKNAQSSVVAAERHSNVLSSRFHVVQYWLRKNIFTRLTQIFAFGPRHLISTDDPNYNGALSMILVLYLKLVTSQIWRHDSQQRRSPNTFWSSTLPSTIQVNEIKGWKILLWKQLIGVIYI